jgi:hypothetical protein
MSITISCSAITVCKNAGAFSDMEAWLLSRRHHRIVVPIAPASSPEPYAELRDKVRQEQWHLTVANMAAWLHGDTESASESIAEKRYYLAASCLTALNEVKCPVATNDANECSGPGRGSCKTVTGYCALAKHRILACDSLGLFADACEVQPVHL